MNPNINPIFSNTSRPLFILNTDADELERQRKQARAEYIEHEKAVTNRLAKLSEENAALIVENQALVAENQALATECQMLAAEYQALTAEKQALISKHHILAAEIKRRSDELAE